MCGRYRLSRRKQIVEEHFDSVSGEEEWTPRYNLAPTQPVPVIRQHPKEPVRQLSLMKWGLIHSWAKDSSVAAQMKCFPTGGFLNSCIGRARTTWRTYLSSVIGRIRYSVSGPRPER